ncbi:MAG: hypothetical protein IJI52_01160 [Solobacterium sp.]|nr:hypothetical protein [Solobacterium sp.]
MAYREIKQKLVPITAVSLVSFSMLYRQSVAYDKSDDKHQYCHPGWYSCSMNLAEQACHLAFVSADGSTAREISFAVQDRDLAALRLLLDDIGVTTLNGWQAENDGSGYELELQGEYAEGAHLRLFARGNYLVSPPADIDEITFFFNELAEKAGCRFTGRI